AMPPIWGNRGRYSPICVRPQRKAQHGARNLLPVGPLAPLEAQDADDARAAAGRVVARVEDAVCDHDLGEIERADAVETGGVDAVFVGVRAAAVVGVDAAARTEIMQRRAGVETVERQDVRA